MLGVGRRRGLARGTPDLIRSLTAQSEDELSDQYETLGALSFVLTFLSWQTLANLAKL